MKWSDAQQRAIDSRGGSLLVAAAAGSGKTAVLTERIVQRILHGDCSIDELLIVTFTNAAAAEMRQRIEAKLQERMQGTKEKKVLELLERQLILLSNASISTLHAFCQTVIRRNFAAIDIDPQFRLASEQEINLIRQDVIVDLFEEKYEAEEPEFLSFVNEYGSDRDDEKLYRMVLQLFQYAQSLASPEAWLKSLPEQFQLPEEAKLLDTVWLPVILQEVQHTLAGCRETVDRLENLAEQLGCEFFVPVFTADREVLNGLEQALVTGDWDILRAAFWGVKKFATLRAPKGTDEELKEQFKRLRERKFKENIKALQQEYFQEDEQEILEDLRAVAPVMQEICKLTREFAAAFAAAKKEKQLVDFNDLEHFALQILRDSGAAEDALYPSAVAKALQQKYKEVMVDEYQDTNGVQEAILSLVARPEAANLFTVGDVKQSIYRFRMADPGLFLQKYETYPTRGAGYERIDLAQNFRSRSEVLAAINFLFAQVMVPGVMELEYNAAAALYSGFDYPDCEGESLQGPVELDILEQDTVDEGAEAELAGFALEAQHIANRLRSLMEHCVQIFDKDTGEYRPIQWRDMVVLLRAVKGKAGILLETLRENDIPAYASVDAGYFEETEIRVMLSLLRVIDNARQDIPLAAVLYSPIVGFSAQELAELRIESPGEDLFGALLLANEPGHNLSEAIREKTARFLGRLSKWRSLSRCAGVTELIWQLYRDTGYYDYVGGMPGGLLRQANLRMLCDRAADYEKTNFRGLFRFLRFIEKMQAMETDLAVARTLGESENVVRIMTVHKSKGLEFPVVVLADINKGFNFMEFREELLIHRELGLGPYRTELDKSLRYPTLARTAIKARITQENKAEEMRVLYVALTRAREKLILVGSVKNLVGKAQEWCRYIDRVTVQLPEHSVLEAGSWLDWIGMAAARHADGEILRKKAGTVQARVNPKYEDTSRWQIQIFAAADVQVRPSADVVADTLLETVRQRKPLAGSDAHIRVEQILAWQYDFGGVEEVPAKLSVTELKRRFAAEEAKEDGGQLLLPAEETRDEMQREVPYYRPAFVRDNTGLRGTEYGTIMHTVMQHIDLHGALDNQGIAGQLDVLVQKEILLPKQRALVREFNVQKFFASSLGRRMQKAVHLWRELPFSRMLKAKRFYPAVQSEKEQIFIQGILDVLFEEQDGGLVLLDYKTDHDTDPERAAKKYQLQMELYSEAAEEILARQIKEKYLYLLHDGSVVRM